jgi:hypothetical protein
MGYERGTGAEISSEQPVHRSTRLSTMLLTRAAATVPTLGRLSKALLLQQRHERIRITI